MFRRSLLFALLIPAIYGCDEEDPCAVAASVEPALRLGTGEDAFHALHEGDHVDVTYGSQGGRHVWMAVRTEGVDPGKSTLIGEDQPGPVLRFTLWSADGVLLGEGGTQQPLEGDPLAAELVGQELYVDWYGETTGAPSPDLSALLVRAELTDRCGVELVEEVAITADLL